MVGGVIDVTYLLETPQGYAWKGAFIDADLRTVEALPRTLSLDDRTLLLMQLSSLQGSVLENRIFEDDFEVGSISTAKLFQLATSILTIDQSNIATVLPTLPFDQNIKDDISASVAEGLTVRIPQSEIAYENWTGIGYIKENPATGESGWMLSGSIAGGMTAWSIDRWPMYYADRLTEPYSEQPNYDPASARFIHKVTKTDMQDGTVGKKLATPLQVKVMDMQWKPVPNVNVTFTIKAGGDKFSNGSATITIPTNRQGIASAELTLGTSTNTNTVYVKKSTDEKYTHKVGENIVDASLASGTTIDAPFTSYAFAGDPVNVCPTYGDGITTAILSFSGFVSVSVEDQYGNPISNLPVDFEAQAAVPQGSCLNPGQKTAQLVKTNDTCLTSAPVWNQCGTANTLISETTNSAGAAVNTILGEIPAAKYPIKATCTDAKCIDQATNQPRSATFNHYTADFGNCGSEGLEAPDVMLALKTTETTDASGHIINAGKSGTSIPVSAKIYYLKEGDRTITYTYYCGLVCDRIVGDQTYSIETSFTTASVSFAGQAGAPQGSGIYSTDYTLKPGVNTITIDVTADTTVQRTHNACPNYCTPPDQTTEPLSASVSMTKTVYGVDITLNTIPTILVDQWGYAAADYPITYSISPAEYQALSAYVLIYKNGTVISTIPLEPREQERLPSHGASGSTSTVPMKQKWCSTKAREWRYGVSRGVYHLIYK